MNKVSTSRRITFTLLSTLAGALYCGQTNAAAFIVHKAESRLVDRVYQLSASIGYELSEEVLAALRNGVPITLVAEIKIIRPRRYIWDEEVAKLKQRYQLQYHVLAEQYIVLNLNSGAKTNHPTYSSAISSFTQISNFPLIDKNLLHSNRNYFVKLRARLELSSLPPPLRLNAYVSDKWRLKSEWFVWNLTTNETIVW